MPDTIEKFSEWCVVEIMGHKRFAGLVTEQAIGGASFVRVDVPEITTDKGITLPAFSKLFGASSIYCLSPCTEETARRFAAALQAEAFSRYELPRLPPPPQQGTDELSEIVDDIDGDDDDDDPDDDGGPW
jgi:hypothetical protein